MQEVSRKLTEKYVVQKLSKTYYSQNIEWRDIWDYHNIRHINEAKKILGKLRRGAFYNKTGEEFRIVKRTIEVIVKSKDEEFKGEDNDI